MRKAVFYHIFHVLCFLLTTFLIGRCLYQYLQDKDVSQIEYHEFHDKEGSIYPSFSICFQGPILEDKLKEITGLAVKDWDYILHLYGIRFNESFQKIDYDQVTIDLKE